VWAAPQTAQPLAVKSAAPACASARGGAPACRWCRCSHLPPECPCQGWQWPWPWQSAPRHTAEVRERAASGKLRQRCQRCQHQQAARGGGDPPVADSAGDPPVANPGQPLAAWLGWNPTGHWHAQAPGGRAFEGSGGRVTLFSKAFPSTLAMAALSSCREPIGVAAW
jgi:hypothetical protein